MPISFERPVGVHRDVKELEYLSALMQTSTKGLRKDASLTVTDVAYYLRSRHGVTVDEELIQSLILTDLAGNMNSDQDLAETEEEKDGSDVLDLCQLLSILLIPHFHKASVEDSCADNLLDRVLASLRYAARETDEATKGNGRDNKKKSVVLTRQVLRNLLTNLDEFHVNDDLLDDMIKVAGGENTELDKQSLLKALSHDLGAFQQSWETSLTTNYYDVTLSSRKVTNEIEDTEHDSLGFQELGEVKAEDGSVYPIKRSYTLPSVDYSAETYRRPLFVASLWVCAIACYFAYVWQTGEGDWLDVDCNSYRSEMSCKIVQGILSWLGIFLQISSLGVLLIVFASFGNSSDIDSKVRAALALLVGMTTIGFLVIAPYFYGTSTKFFYTEGNKGDESPIYDMAYWISLILGCILLAFQLCDMVRLVRPEKWRLQNAVFTTLFTPGTVRMESRHKQAASHKMSQMIDNAREMHCDFSNSSVHSSHQGSSFKDPRLLALVNFQLQEDEMETIGGIFWAWKKIFNGTLFCEEGIWLHARLFAANFAQIMVFIFVVYFGSLGYKYGNQFYTEDAFDDQTLDDQSFDDQSLVDDDVLIIVDSGLETFDEVVESLSIAQWEYNLAISVGLIAGVLASGYVAIVYVPSFITSVLMFRSGILPSLRGGTVFREYRNALDTVTVLLGSAFWGSFFASSFAGLIFSGLVLLVFIDWPGNFGKSFGGQIIGFVVILIIRQLILTLLRLNFFSGFYRKRPAGSNIWFVVMEIWNIALAVGFMLIRAVKVLLISVFFIARTDTPFLAPGVGYVGPVNLDYYSAVFRRDLLLHEAHRHCLIERLGLIYLLKLKHRDNFANRAGSCWRLLYVLALMPWMRKYRVCSDGVSKSQAEVEAEVENEQIGRMSIRRMSIRRMSTRRMNLLPDNDVVALQMKNDVLKEATQDLSDQLQEALAKNKLLEQKLLQYEDSVPEGKKGVDAGLNSFTAPNAKPLDDTELTSLKPPFRGDEETEYNS